MFEQTLDEYYWDRYPLGIQYAIHNKLTAFETRAKENMEIAILSGRDNDYELISKVTAIVGYNIEELERSMCANEYDVTEYRFGTEPYYLN